METSLQPCTSRSAHVQGAPADGGIAVMQPRENAFFSRLLTRLGLWLVARYAGRQALAATDRFSVVYAEQLIARVHDKNLLIRFYEDAFRDMPIAGILADMKGNILLFNRCAEDLFEIDECTARRQFNLFGLCADSASERETILRLLRLENRVHSLRTEIRGINGKRTHVVLSLNRAKDAEGRDIAFVSVLKDNDELERLIRTDHLTQVWNRAEYDRQLVKELKRLQRGAGGSISLLIIDLDKFKQINDTHGHRTGDEALRCTGEILKACVRDIDTPARYGGEEFAVILPGTDGEHALMVAERIRQRIAKVVIRSEKTSEAVRFTASIGISTRAADRKIQVEQLERELVGQADTALYQAKNAGRNRTCVHTPR